MGELKKSLEPWWWCGWPYSSLTPITTPCCDPRQPLTPKVMSWHDCVNGVWVSPFVVCDGSPEKGVGEDWRAGADNWWHKSFCMGVWQGLNLSHGALVQAVEWTHWPNSHTILSIRGLTYHIILWTSDMSYGLWVFVSWKCPCPRSCCVTVPTQTSIHWP